MKHSSAQSGSALFVILIAIALFAALSYAFTRGGQGNQSQLTDQQTRIAAQEIISYGNTLADAVQKLRLRNCGDTQLDFANSSWKEVGGTLKHPPNHNPNAPTNGCSVFSIADGKLQPVVFPRTHSSQIPISATQNDYGVGIMIVMQMPDVGTTSADLVYMLPHVQSDVCTKINSTLGISVVPQVSISGYTPYIGDLSSTANLSGSLTSIRGKTMYCVLDSGTAGEYRFFATAIAK